MATATASFVIDFGAAGADVLLAAELDEVRNSGKTSFQAGDTVYFRVYHNTPYSVLSTDGTTSKVISNERGEIPAEIVQFVHSKQADVSKKVYILGAYTWFGFNLGALSAVGGTKISASLATELNFGVCKVSYTTEYDVWRLQAPVNMPTEYAILVLVIAG